MLVHPELIDRIYEAAASPHLWPAVLEQVAGATEAFGVCFVHRSPAHAGWVVSERMEEFAAEYVREGWLTRDDRVPPVIAEQYPGFRTDADYRTEQQVSELPVYRDFLLPRGCQASAASALQGAGDDALHIGVEGLPSYTSARRLVPLLNAMRPHLGRAISVSAKLLQARLEASVATLQLTGMGAAVVGADGRSRAVNDQFVRQLGSRLGESRGKVRFTDQSVERQFKAALAALAAMNSDGGVRSFAVAAAYEDQPLAIHVIPLRRSARDVFGWDGALLLLAQPYNASVPGADLLRLLFDLTPAEARLTRLLLEGRTPAEAASALGITDATVRVHLRRVFAKTGVTRQAELVRLLAGLGPPVR